MYFNVFQQKDDVSEFISRVHLSHVDLKDGLQNSPKIVLDTRHLSISALIPSICKQVALASLDSEAEGFKPANSVSFEQMKRFFDGIPPLYIFEEPVAALGPDGSIGLLWEDESIYAYLDFRTDNRLHYCTRMGDEVGLEEVFPALMDYSIVYPSILPFIANPFSAQTILFIFRYETTISQVSASGIIQLQATAKDSLIVEPENLFLLSYRG